MSSTKYLRHTKICNQSRDPVHLMGLQLRTRRRTETNEMQQLDECLQFTFSAPTRISDSCDDISLVGMRSTRAYTEFMPPRGYPVSAGCGSRPTANRVLATSSARRRSLDPECKTTGTTNPRVASTVATERTARPRYSSTTARFTLDPTIIICSLDGAAGPQTAVAVVARS